MGSFRRIRCFRPETSGHRCPEHTRVRCRHHAWGHLGGPHTLSPSGRRMAAARSMASPGGPGQPHRCGHARLTQRHEAVLVRPRPSGCRWTGCPVSSQPNTLSASFAARPPCRAKLPVPRQLQGDPGKQPARTATTPALQGVAQGGLRATGQGGGPR